MSRTFVFVTDTHLSRSRPFFHFNWEVFIAAMRRKPPDLIVFGGDNALDGPGNPDDLAFVREQCDRLPCRWLAVPGNHDVGANPVPQDLPDERGEGVIDAGVLSRYRQHLGRDYWQVDLGGRRIVGLNSQLLGSGLKDEADQEAFLAAAMDHPEPVILVTHKPPFHRSMRDGEFNQKFWYPPARRLLEPYLAKERIELILAGHRHERRDTVLEGVRHVWGAPLAFVTDAACNWSPSLGGERKVGWTVVTIGKTLHVEIAEPDDLLLIDIGGWMRSGSIELYRKYTHSAPFYLEGLKT